MLYIDNNLTTIEDSVSGVFFPVSESNPWFRGVMDALVAAGIYDVERGVITGTREGILEWKWPQKTIADVISSGKNAIDSMAGGARSKYLTVTPGQEMTYQAKTTEFKQYIADGRPHDLAHYPWLAAECVANNVNPSSPNWESVSTLCDGVLSLAAAWSVTGAHIEQIRLLYKNKIAAGVYTSVSQAEEEVNSLVAQAVTEFGAT